jgi:CTP synthase
MGGTMRLGSRRTLLQTVDCTTAKLYQVDHHCSTWQPWRWCNGSDQLGAWSINGFQWCFMLHRSLMMQREQYIDERHRHRYEVNPDLVEQLEQHGLRFVGKDETVRTQLHS